MLIAICCIIWFVIGYGILLHILARDFNEITVADLFVCCLSGLLGPIALIFYIIYNKNDIFSKKVWVKKLIK